MLLSSVLKRLIERNAAGQIGRRPMIVCEYRFESFDTLGDDEQIDRFAKRLDGLFQAGWLLVESKRDLRFRGWWCVELVKPHLASTGPTSARQNA